MDIESFRLGLAYGALKQALGEDCSALSFSPSGIAFLDRRSGSTFFCLARRDALWMARVGADGVLGDGSDPESQRLRALAEPAYVARAGAFERELDACASRERRQAKAAPASNAPPAAGEAPERLDNRQPAPRAGVHRRVVVRGTAAKA